MEHARSIFARYMTRRIEEGTFGGGSGDSRTLLETIERRLARLEVPC